MPLVDIQQLSTEITQKFANISIVRSFWTSRSQANSAARPQTVSAFVVCAYVKLSAPDSLRETLDQWIKILSGAESFQNVRHLKLLPVKVVPISRRLPDCGDRPLNTWQYFPAIYPSIQTLQHDSEWQQLAHFIRKLPGMLDLTWGCMEQIAPCVLKALHDERPTCRLDLQSFLLRSLVQLPSQPIVIDSYELELATSPCLHSLALRYDYLDSDGNANYNEDAVADMVAVMTPNLRKVSLLFESSGNSPARVRSLRVPRRRGRGDEMRQRSSMNKLGALTWLELCVIRTGRMLRLWSNKTESSAHGVLKLHSSVNASDLQWLTKYCRLPSLHTLVISPENDRERNMGQKELYSATQGFLRSLPGLVYLKMFGEFDEETLRVAVETHGRVLQHLLLSHVDIPEEEHGWILSGKILTQIWDCCPVLQELAIPLQRSMGNTDELARYTTLGSFRMIRRIHLFLDCSRVCDAGQTVLSDFDTHAREGNKELGDTEIRKLLETTLLTRNWRRVSSKQSPALDSRTHLRFSASKSG